MKHFNEMKCVLSESVLKPSSEGAELNFIPQLFNENQQNNKGEIIH